MSLKHHLLSASYKPLKFKNFLLKKFSGLGSIRVLLYHDIAPNDELKFAAQLRWLKRSWEFITPATFASIVSNGEPVHRNYLLLSFDDGFSSNRRIAEDILNPMGIKALFFIVSEFISLDKKSDSKNFIATNIYPDLNLKNIPDHWFNMTWGDINYLLETGHTIGSHTSSHARLSHLGLSDLPKEIISSADFLSKKIGLDIDHFAYTFGDLNSFSSEALAIARSRFKFIYTGMRGNNVRGVKSWAIRRDALSANDSLSLVGAFLEGAADSVYSRKLTTYEKWGRG